MSRFAAKFVEKELQIQTTGLSGKNFVLGLPTGSTPIGMYERLIEMNRAWEVDFSKVTTFNLDEYYPIKRDNSQSYYKFMFDNLFGKINIDKKNINILSGEVSDADSECLEYEKKIEAAGGIDLMVIGLGANGHIGFNEPGDFLIPYTHATDLTQDTREKNMRFFNSLDEVPSKALTMGMGSILKAKKILMLVSGESKKEAFKNLLDGKITTKIPVSFLHLHRDVTVLSDMKL
ncbi:MAG: glucosamine-6-phosphate deaminase [Oscillospiraceae bacterium]|nr:glucosamine-6-phosphate deaminase [Oscillospiraceae bacterium]